MKYNAYRSVEPSYRGASLTLTSRGLKSPSGHIYEFIEGTEIPVFAKFSQGANEYAYVNSAEIHDNALKWLFDTFETDENSFRESVIARIGLKKGYRVLVTGVGSGNDIPYLARALSFDGDIYAQDISEEMLLSAVSRYQAEYEGSEVALHFSVSDASNLPFADGFFDAAYHFGGINIFSDVYRGIAEMNRVVRDGGKVVIGDEGLAPWLINTELGQSLIKNNSLYSCQAPLHALPSTARNVKLSWELSNSFYIIEFNVSSQQLPVNIDIPHIGKRGGSIRTRYYGILEGIDPELKNYIYAEADRRGLSRVNFLEALLRSSLLK